VLQVGDRLQHHINVVVEVTESRVARQAQHAANVAGRMVVIDVVRSALSTDRALPALLNDQLIRTSGADSVPSS
jgi:hypothetical protein